jgi:hypothetical protein
VVHCIAAENLLRNVTRTCAAYFLQVFLECVGWGGLGGGRAGGSVGRGAEDLL